MGQEKFRSLTKNYYRNPEGVILVFDVNIEETFQGLKNWLNCINDNVEINFPKVVICNKIDLDRKITSLQIQKYSKDTNTYVFESSAKSDIKRTIRIYNK